VKLTSPNGSVAFQETLPRTPGSYPVTFPPPTAAPATQGPNQVPPPAQPQALAEGRWTLTIDAVDDQGLGSTTTRRFAVNTTIGFLRAPARTTVRPRTGGKATIQWRQARAAKVKVHVRTSDGALARAVVGRRLQPGAQTATWNGKLQNGKVAAGGSYVVRVEAANELGIVVLERPLTVRRLAAPPGKKPGKKN
jgi:hypothetical protein